MHNDSAMPTIEFGDGTDYNSLYALLHFANEGLNWGEDEGITFDFLIEGGGSVTGSFYLATEDDDMVISLHDGGSASGEFATVETDLIERLVYL